MPHALLSAVASWGKKAEAAPAVRSFGFTDEQVFEYGALLLALVALHVASLVIRQPSVVFKAVKAADAAHLAAHFVASLVAFACFAVYGTRLWVVGATDLDTCGDDHITGYCAGSSRITIMMMAFQSYEVLLALYVPKLRGPTGDMLVHHVATLALATLGGGYQYLHFYAPFFFGLTEISSVRGPRAARLAGAQPAALPPATDGPPARRSSLGRCRSLSWTSSSFSKS